jgi:hypothetical protein
VLERAGLIGKVSIGSVKVSVNISRVIESCRESSKNIIESLESCRKSRKL